MSVIKSALRKGEYLIIAIGSAEDSFQPENPFTAGERFQMIKTVLDAEKIDPANYCIIPIRNINNYNLWCKHVASLIPDFNKVFTGSALVKKLFEAEKKYEIKDVEKKLNICATQIRKKMLKDQGWQEYLHPAAIEVIKKINGIERIKSINQSLK